MELWMWVVIAVITLPTAVVIFVVGLLAVSVWIEKLSDELRAIGYRIDAKRHNKKARALRLSHKEWQGLPLPSGKSGSLRITERTLIQFPYSYRQIEKIMLDRAKDLEVDISITRDIKSNDFVVTWRKHKKEKK